VGSSARKLSRSIYALSKIPGKNNSADIGTKTLSTPVFTKYLSDLGFSLLEDEEEGPANKAARRKQGKAPVSLAGLVRGVTLACLTTTAKAQQEDEMCSVSLSFLLSVALIMFILGFACGILCSRRCRGGWLFTLGFSKPEPEEEPQAAATEEEPQATATEETTQAIATEETAQASSPEETTQAATPEETAQASTREDAAQAATRDEVVITRFGVCFHREGCETTLLSRNLRRVSRREAVVRFNLRPCQSCGAA